MNEDPVKPGRVLAGRYRLEERLGVGGMGAIWRAEHLVLSAPVAVKLLDRDVTDSEENAARFMREAKAAANLRSTHVVQILDYGVDDMLPFIVMELLEGETLRQRLKREKTLDAVQMARIVTDVCRAMARAHEAGVVHRDLKPENIFLVQEADTEVTKVLDFGVAKVEAATLGPQGTKTRTGSLLGTPYYMSPEQAQGNKEVDYRSDLWSVAVIAFECLTGKRPFMSDALGDLVLQICIRPIPVPSEHATVPSGFDEWFARATARDPDERFQSAREMADALRDGLGDEYRLTINTTPDENGDGRSDRGREVASVERADTEVQTGQQLDPDDVPVPPSDAILDDTMLATPVGLHPPSMADSTAPPAPGNRALLYVVGFSALALGIAGGVWLFRELDGSRHRTPPDVTVANLAGDRQDAAAQQPHDAGTDSSRADSAALPTERAVGQVEGDEAEDAGPFDAGPEALAPEADVEDAAPEAGFETMEDAGEVELPDAGEPEPALPALPEEEEEFEFEEPDPLDEI